MAVIDSSEAEGKERNLTSQLDGAERIISDGCARGSVSVCVFFATARH